MEMPDRPRDVSWPRRLPARVGPVPGRAHRLLGDLDLAEDAVQEAFAVGGGTLGQRPLPPDPLRWLTTVARTGPSTGSAGRPSGPERRRPPC